MKRIPVFTNDGLLPPGDYEVSLDELRESVLVVGPSDAVAYPNWDAQWRRQLVDNLEVMVRQLWQVNVTDIFVDGSFAEDKDHPNDIDGYFVCDLHRLASGELERDLNLIDPHKVWTWEPASRRPYRGYPKRQFPIWHQYRVELIRTFAACCRVSAMSTVMSWNFRRLFDVLEGTENRVVSSRFANLLEANYDSQRERI